MMKKIELIEKKCIEIGKSLGVILLYFLLQIILGLLFKDCLNSESEFISSMTLFLTYLLTLLIILLIFLPKVVDNGRKFKKDYIKVAFKNWGLGFLLMFVSNFFIVLYTGDIASNETANRELLATYTGISIIMVTILAPLLEEIVFRLSLRKSFSNKYVYCIISALLFGFIHILSSGETVELLYLIPYGGLGFFFAKAYYETDNIFTSILAHAFHNTLSLIVILLGMVLL